MGLQPGHDCPSPASRLSKCPNLSESSLQPQETGHHRVVHALAKGSETNPVKGNNFSHCPGAPSPFPHSYRNHLHSSNTCSNAKSQKKLPPTSTAWAVVTGTARHLALHHLGMCNRHRRLGPKQQALISPGSGCWTSTVRVPEDFTSAGELLPGSWMAVFFLCPHVAGRELESSLGPLCKGANPIMGAPPS